MTLLSCIYMLAVWAAILALNIYCFYRMFTTSRKPKDGGT